MSLSIPTERISGFSPPKQDRSRDCLERIVTATRSLLDARDAADISLGQITELADVSTSSLYNLFDNKDALVDYVHAVHCREKQAEIRLFLDRIERERPEFGRMVHDLFLFAISLTRRSAALSQAFRRAGTHIPAIARREERVESENLERFEQLLVRVWDGEMDPELRGRVRDGIRVFTTLLREGGNTPGVTTLFTGVSDDDLATNLSGLALRLVDP